MGGLPRGRFGARGFRRTSKRNCRASGHVRLVDRPFLRCISIPESKTPRATAVTALGTLDELPFDVGIAGHFEQVPDMLAEVDTGSVHRHPSMQFGNLSLETGRWS